MFEKECQEKIVIDGVNVRLIKTFEHPNCGVYAVEVEDAQNRHWIVPSEDIESEFMVDNEPVDVLKVFQQDGYGIVGYLVQFPDGRKLLTEYIDQ